jgi:hypothetical protein
VQLSLEPVGGFFLALEDLFEHFARAVVALLAAQGDAGVEPLDGLGLQREVEAVLLDGVLAHAHRIEALHVRHAVEVEDALDHRLGVFHLVLGFVALLAGEALITPVLAHLVVDEVLVDGRELGGEHVVQRLEHLGVALHVGSSVGFASGRGYPRPAEWPLY